MKKLMIMLMLLVIPSTSFALSHEQYEIAKMAALEGAKINEAARLDVVGIIHQETRCGKLGRVGDDGKSLGVGQMQPKTAIYMLDRYFPHHTFTLKTVAEKLLSDDKFAIMLSAIYYKYLLHYFDGDRDKAILAYNVGPTKVRKFGLSFDPNGYLALVYQHRRFFKGKV